MKPPSSFRPRCPHADCSSHSGGRSRVIRHARLATRRGVRLRYLCRACRRTFVPTRGTPYYRMRRPRREFDQAMQLVVEGVSSAAVARTQRLSPSTVGRWTERAARQARRFDEENLRLDAAVEMQLDELNSHGAGERDPDWVFGAIEVWSRVWAAARGSRRTLRETLVFVRRLRATFLILYAMLVFVPGCSRPRSAIPTSQGMTLSQPGEQERFVEYSSSGLRLGEGAWMVNRKEGMWLYWYESGALKSKGVYNAGRMNDLWVCWDEDGAVLQAGFYFDDRRNGPWLFGSTESKRSGYYEDDVLKRPLDSKECEFLRTLTRQENAWRKGSCP